MFKKGYVPWNKGLTKETDERILNHSISLLKIKWFEDHKNDIVYCQCGCDKLIEIKKSHKYNGIPKYLPGHKNNNNTINKKNMIKQYEECIKNPQFCKCGCGEKITVKKHYLHTGVPKYIFHHGKRGYHVNKPLIDLYEEALINCPLCSCGCGQEIKIIKEHKYVGIPKYIKNHAQKTEIFRQKVSEFHGRKYIEKYGEKRSKEILANFVLKTTGVKKGSKYDNVDIYSVAYCECGCGERINIKDCHRYTGIPSFISGHNSRTEEARERSRRFFRNNKFSVGRKHTEEAKAKNREARLKRIYPKKDSIPEKILQDKLSSVGIDFERHKIVIKWQSDIFIYPNVCIFVDGDYWHGNPEKYDKDVILFGDKTAGYLWERDTDITIKLQNAGYNVIRIWENDIKRNIDLCINYIIGEIGQ